MGNSKSEEFSVRDNRVAEFAKAIAHPARVAILRVLMEEQSCICGDIVDRLPLSQSTVSQHLRELKNAGLIRGEIDGPRVCYCIDPDAWKDLSDTMNKLFTAFKPQEISCC